MLNHNRIKLLLTQVSNSLPSGISEEALEKFVQRTGIKLPNDFIELLRISNAPIIGQRWLFGISDDIQRDIEATLKDFPEFSQKGWIPIGTDGFGNQYVLSTQQEFGEGYPILFVDPISDLEKPAFIVASDIQHFIEYLIEDEIKNSAYIFNKALALEYDPDLLSFHGVQLPWEA